MSAKIFIVDDERTIRLTFRTALETEGYEVQEAATADEALTGLRAETYQLVILDLRLGDDSGLEVLERMRATGVLTPTLMITAYGSVRDAVRAVKLGAIDFLSKPIEPAALRAVVADILRRHGDALPAETSEAPPRTFQDFLRVAKRQINLRDFPAAEDSLAAALTFDEASPGSAEAHNLRGVLHEMHGEFDAAKAAYGQAIKLNARYEPAQENMKRIFELFNFGTSQRSFHVGHAG